MDKNELVKETIESEELVRNVSLNCSFCGKSQSEVGKIIAGPEVHICNECIDLCSDILITEGHVDKRVVYDDGDNCFVIPHIASLRSNENELLVRFYHSTYSVKRDSPEEIETVKKDIQTMIEKYWKNRR